MTPTTHSTRRPENLAFVFQELLTVGERLRSNRQQVADAASFRAQIWTAVRQAEDDARRRGYSTDDIELAVFAAVAFLDESILNLRTAGVRGLAAAAVAGGALRASRGRRNLFPKPGKAVRRAADSHELADLLEVYQLALLLGFAGRYSMGGRGDLRGITMQTGDRIQRIRQTSGWLAPGWQLPMEPPVKSGGDPWVSRMAVILIVCVVMVVVLFGMCVVLLNQGVNDLDRMAGV